MNIAVIPARGGSKRVPGKNIRSLGDRPIIVHVIETALKSGLFKTVLVSTDSMQIADIAREAGAEVPFLRPKPLADDHTSTADVLFHAVSWMREKGRDFESFCCVYPTAAFLTISDLKRGRDLLYTEDADTVFGVTSFDFPVYRALRIREDRRLEMVWPEYELTRTNDLPELYHDAGQFYWIRLEPFLKRKRVYSANALPVILPRYRAVDIDTEEDWEIAEQVWASLRRKETLEEVYE